VGVRETGGFIMMCLYYKAEKGGSVNRKRWGRGGGRTLFVTKKVGAKEAGLLYMLDSIHKKRMITKQCHSE
jgi:hypothetical protein